MSEQSTIDRSLLELPDDATVARAIAAFASAARRHYGSRLVGLLLFGSRARGDHTRESDADVAVVLDQRRRTCRMTPFWNSEQTCKDGRFAERNGLIRLAIATRRLSARCSAMAR
jgi:hypothetical protein